MTKVVIVGVGGVGKTAWRKALTQGKFEKRYIATIGVEVTNHDAHGHTFALWDTAGQERFSGLNDAYYIKSHAAIFVFDLTAQITFDGLRRYFWDVIRVMGDVPYVICGMKSDVAVRKVTRKEIDAMIGDSAYVEISAKDGTNVDEPLRILAEQLALRADRKRGITKRA